MANYQDMTRFEFVKLLKPGDLIEFSGKFATWILIEPQELDPGTVRSVNIKKMIYNKELALIINKNVQKNAVLVLLQDTTGWLFPNGWSKVE